MKLEFNYFFAHMLMWKNLLFRLFIPWELNLPICFCKHNSKLKEWKLKYNPAAKHFSAYYIMNSILFSSLKGLADVNLVTNRIRPLDIQQQAIFPY